MALFSVVVVDLIGFGIILPLLPFIATHFKASGFQIGCLFSVFSLSQFICSPWWGKLSDKIGRRPIILIGIAGTFISYFLFATAQSFEMLFFSRMLAGVMGGNLAAAQAYIADVTTKEERSKFMALFGASFGVGFTLGPAIASLTMSSWFLESGFYQQFSILNNYQPYAVPGMIACSFSCISFLLAIFFLTEPARASTQDNASNKYSSLLTLSFWKMLSKHQISLLVFLLGMFVLAFSQANLYASLPMMCQQVLGMNSSNVGILYAIMGLSSILVQGVILRELIGRIQEKYLYIVGAAVAVIGYVLLARASSFEHVMMALVTLTVGMGFCVPLLQTAISRNTASDQQGFMMGASQGMSGLGRVVGPVWGGTLFEISVKLPFVATTAVMMLTFIPAYFLMKDRRSL